MRGPVNTRCLLLALLILLAARPAWAGLQEPDYVQQWLIVPAHPTTRDSIVVRHVYSGCGGQGAWARELVFHPDGTIDFYEGDTSDTCDEPFAVDQVTDTDMGHLAAGVYTIRFIGCSIPYDPSVPDCRPSNRSPIHFTVTDAGRPRQVVPTLSDAVKLALAAMSALAGLALLRTRR